MYDFAQNRVKKLFLQLLRVRWRAIYDLPTLEYRPPMTFVVVRRRRKQSQQGQGLETKHFEFSIFVWSRPVQLYFSRAVNYWRSSDNCPLPDEVLHAIGHGAARTSVLRLQQSVKLCPLLQWYGHQRVLGIPIPKTLVIRASPVTLTLTQIAKVIWERDAYITRVLGMGMPKTRGCPYHCIVTPHYRNYIIRGMGTSFRGNDFWDCLVGQASVMIGWWSRQLLTYNKQRLSSQTSLEIVAPIALTHSPYSFCAHKMFCSFDSTIALSDISRFWE